MQPLDLNVRQLGPLRFDSPLYQLQQQQGGRYHFTSEDQRVPLEITAGSGPSFEKAGPRRRIFFDPTRTNAAIVTCGGLCPGLNDVVRGLVLELYYWYGVRTVMGIRYGYGGLAAEPILPPRELTPEDVADIHQDGGSMLGNSRARVEASEMVDTLERLQVRILFCIGGDGTLRGAHAIAGEVARRGLPISIVGIPKTIDNDIELVFRSFGFETAVGEAVRVLNAAHNEARGAPNGIGLVKLMGRESGFIAAKASIASGDVNYCLVPEIPFFLEGRQGLLAHLRRRLRERRHAVIAVAEGAGRHLIGADAGVRPAGTAERTDVGLFLRDSITEAFGRWGEPVHVKYFDPSYLIRSVAANSNDSTFCSDLARRAVHAAMAGRTDMMVGLWHGVFTHVPLAAVVGRRKKIDPDGNLWLGVISTTGQPCRWV